MQTEFGLLNILIRWVLGLLLVLGTYNPYAMSYYQWVAESDGLVSLKVLTGIVLTALHIVAVLASVRSLGPIGIGLSTALFAAAAWVMADNQLLYLEDPRVFTLTLLVILSTVYGIGMSWSHVRIRLSGQVDSTDVSRTSPI